MKRAGSCRIALASYVYSLDNQTTSNYLAFATSYFGAHSLISSLQVAQSIIGAWSYRVRTYHYALPIAFLPGADLERLLNWNPAAARADIHCPKTRERPVS